MQKDAVVIVAIARTPQGNLSGCLKDFTAPQLGAAVLRALIQKTALPPDSIEEVMMGCILSAGIGQAPARQAALLADLSNHTPCTTINKMCGSGMKTIMLARDAILSGSRDCILAGGMESMTQAPYLLPHARSGFRLGHAACIDHLMCDGLENAADKKPMGYFADLCAQTENISRAKQDAFALTSFERARTAIQKKYFSREITPLSQQIRTGTQIIDTDEHPNSVMIEKLTQLKPIFMENGTVTAGNASSIADGAAAVLVMSEKKAHALGLTPLARIIGQSTHAQSPETFTTAPIHAIKKLLHQIHWDMKTIDLFEINEAFAVVTLAAMQALAIPHEKLNIHGGACALGHPIGASGARIVVTLLAALQQHGLKRGVAALCIGGGEATAIAFETL